MQRLSSNITLFVKIFIPLSWVSFFGLFGIVLLFLEPTDDPFLTSSVFKMGYAVFFVIFFTLIYFTLFQFKRVEFKDGNMFITNYFKAIKFPLENVKRINVVNLFFVKIGRIHLNRKGYFGSKIPFIIQRTAFDNFASRYPAILMKA